MAEAYDPRVDEVVETENPVLLCADYVAEKVGEERIDWDSWGRLADYVEEMVDSIEAVEIEGYGP